LSAGGSVPAACSKFINMDMLPATITCNGYTIITDKSLMHIADVHQWLHDEAYWCQGIPLSTFRTAFEHSYCVGALYHDKQVAFARLITDYATFGYLADVFVQAEHRGLGISKKMMEILMDQDWVKGLRCIRLATMGAHGLYQQYGFTTCQHPGRIMEIVRPGIYTQPTP